MPFDGKLRTWHDERGFGFIAPTGGGRELFVHVSAFPRDGARPTVGESLTYEIGPGKDGKPQAVRVIRKAWGATASNSPNRPRDRPRKSFRALPAIVGLILVVAVAAVGYGKYQSFIQRESHQASPSPNPMEREAAVQSPASLFRCDGRTHCSQMTSCAEAKYFLQHCPGTQMDGNNDGVPCEMQWCTSPLAK